MIYADLTLSRKLEGTEARANVDFVETHARLSPESGATWIEVAGTYAMFDGVGSPLTQTFGLGMFEEATDECLEQIERFFIERGADVFHEVSPMTDPSLMPLLTARGYRPVELTSVMYRDLRDSTEFEVPLSSAFGVPPSGGPSRDIPATPVFETEPPEGGTPNAPQSRLQTRLIEDSEADLWAKTAAAGWATVHESLSDFMLAFGKIAARTNGGQPFLAELEGRPVAAAGFQMYDDVCILAGAATIPEARRQGAQNALLRARLQFAIDQGCSLAMMCALPGSQSQMNAQKNGFAIAYTRTKWQLTL